MGDYERSAYEALLDIDYAITLAELHERLFFRVKKLITLLNLVAGSAAFASVLGKAPLVAAGAALIVAASSACDLVFDFGAIASKHQLDKQRFLALRSRASKLTLQRLDAEIAKVNATCATTIEALELPAFNDNLRRHGRIEHVVQPSWWQSFVRTLA